MATERECANLKVGDYVEFKYDIEQGGKIESIKHEFGRKTYYVRAFHGEYVDNINGTVIGLSCQDIWLD